MSWLGFVFIMRSKLLSNIWIALSLFSICLTAQDYKSSILPFEVNPNATNIQLVDGKFSIRSINAVESGSGTTLMNVDRSLNKSLEIDFEDLTFTRDSPQWDDDSYWAFAQSTIIKDQYFIIQLDRDFEVLYIDTFNYSLIEGGESTMTIIDDQVILGIWDNGDCNFICSFMHFKVFSKENLEFVNSFNIDDSEPSYFSRQIVNINGKLFSGRNTFGDVSGSFAVLYKLDSIGEIIWKYISSDNQSRGNVPVYITELSNGNIVYTDKVERPDLWPQGYNEDPAKIGWLTPEGDSLREHIMVVPRNNIVELSGIKTGLSGDYFYFYGSRDYEGVDYGFIVKMTNEGQVLWEKRYTHLNLTDDNYIIRDMEELPNGDIITLGRKSIVGEKVDIWMMRLNEHGCFGTDTCSSEPLYTSTSNIELIKKNVLFYPNPTDCTLYIADEYASDITSYNIYTTEGRLIIKDNPIAYGKIDVSALESGVYVVALRGKDGAVYTEQVVKE